jgi:hypothetical protein
MTSTQSGSKLRSRVPFFLTGIAIASCVMGFAVVHVTNAAERSALVSYIRIAADKVSAQGPTDLREAGMPEIQVLSPTDKTRGGKLALTLKDSKGCVEVLSKLKDRFSHASVNGQEVTSAESLEQACSSSPNQNLVLTL